MMGMVQDISRGRAASLDFFWTHRAQSTKSGLFATFLTKKSEILPRLCEMNSTLLEVGTSGFGGKPKISIKQKDVTQCHIRFRQT
jgi:hypothetical protein